MARRKRTTKQAEELQKEEVGTEAQSSGSEADSQQLEKPKKAKKAAPKKAEKQEEASNLIHLEDACRRFVVGYKDHWYPSIDRYARSHGYTGEATEERCRELLSMWGAKLN